MDEVTLVACGVCGGSVPAGGDSCPRCGETRVTTAVHTVPAPSIRTLQPGDPEAIGRFRLLGRLGAGGMGVVFLGRDDTGALAAVKMVRPELAGQRPFRIRFAREVSAAAAVSGRYTARVLDHDLDGDTQWVATQYVPGPTLAEQVERHGALPGMQAQLLALGLAEALRAIHGAGLVHRDLKPSNVILAADGPRVIDFGIAQSLDATSLTETGAVVGTLAWLAPEQVTGGAVSAATDVFAWGLVAAFAALGRHPYGEGRPEAIAFRVVHEKPQLDGLPPSLAPAVAAALRPRAEDRVSLPGLLALLGDPDRTVVDATIAGGWDATVAGPMPAIPTPPASPGSSSAQRRRRRLVPVLGALTALAVVAAGGAAAGGLGSGPDEQQTQDSSAAGSPAKQQESSSDGTVAATNAAQAPPAPESRDFVGTCTWTQREQTRNDDFTMGPALYEADCGEAGRLTATARYIDGLSGYVGGGYVLSGSIDGVPFELEAQAPYIDYETGNDYGPDRWDGTFDGLTVRLLTERDGNGYVVTTGSRIGSGAIEAVGPQPDVNDAAGGPDDYFRWDDPSTVSGRYFAEDSVTQAQAAALVNLLTVGVPASGIIYLV